ncbi:enoyl-[acyl-carrier protein] reductase / trans-2-enoyl-CoA reductase (NAD+) [Clostridium acidisoli DSM 12555]|uniref:Trans-2-enoyl-CoA reductase [NADH] n=1 Tax=Clostridium acidisoli DSM 12555 TaxID=1121291 RepID=A0A1W1XQ11_9CLOT|nr:enoyl-ACP reductase FabV [Clostridium acidisoli]SMC25935.1 enoyl-[acyl-carrier protein] reductase / trans-2-enoyl-CoA reductase (NAD+) [Clostridium acidisoli DSM 12555]
MLIKPKFRDFICVTAHPEGCKKNVDMQIEYIKENKVSSKFKRILIIGASTGYGLSSRIVSTFGWGASTIGVIFDRQGTDSKTGTAGWYNTAAFEKSAIKDKHYAKTINGDAFSNKIKEKTIELIKKDLKKVDLVIYSIASPRRKHPITGEVSYSVLKPIGEPFKNKSVDFHTFEVFDTEIGPATKDEIQQTINVMGGEDWSIWIDQLLKADVLEQGACTIAYSYIGPEITYPIYRSGTIGVAKEDLENSSLDINLKLKQIGGNAYISVNKALVTQSSSAIPVVPLYISLLDKVMKEKGLDEDATKQIHRLFSQFDEGKMNIDSSGRIRIDDREMREDVQKEIKKLWQEVTTDNVEKITNINVFREDFFKLFGFGYDDVDYEKETCAKVEIFNLL